MSIYDKYFRYVEDFYSTNTLTLKGKASDYASDNDPFSNFRFAALAAGVTVEQVFLVLLGVKLARLRELLTSDKEPANESVDDTLGDDANYAAILAAYRHFKNGSDPDYAWADFSQMDRGEMDPDEPLVGDPGDEQEVTDPSGVPASERLLKFLGF